MSPNVEPTEQVLSDVTERLQALNRSQTSLASMTSSRSMPVARLPCGRRSKHSCDLCLKQCSSSTQLQFHRQTHVMENMAVRLRSNKAVSSPEGLKAKQELARQRDLEGISLGSPSKTKLESLLYGGKLKIRRGKANIAPKAHISTFFASRKTSQRSASSGDSGYESMERPDPVASLLGMRTREFHGQDWNNGGYSAPTAPPVKADTCTGSGDHGVADIRTSTYSYRRRCDEIKKYKKFSKQLERTPLLKHGNTMTEEHVSEIGESKAIGTGLGRLEADSGLVGRQLLKSIDFSVPSGIAAMTSAMSSTDDVLGELVSPTSYRSRMESCRQSGASMSDGELSFMGIRAPSLHSVNLRDTEGDTLAERLAQNVVKRCLDTQYHQGIRSRTASRQDSNQSTPPSSARHTPTTSVSSTSKRSRGREGGNEDPGDEDVRRRDSDTKRSRLEAQQDLKLFACPYSKHDPQRYSELNLVEKEYRRCSCCYLRDIPRLKQHLYRVHRRPEYYCGSCFDSFKSREFLDVHVRQRPSCELRSPKFEEKMTDDQLNSIKRRIVKGDPCELWFNIFKTLFPSAPRPLSPYASDNDPTVVNHFVNLFRLFGPEELFSLMHDRREQMEGLLPLEASTQAIVDEAFEIALPAFLQTQEDGCGPILVEPDLARINSASSNEILFTSQAPVANLGAQSLSSAVPTTLDGGSTAVARNSTPLQNLQDLQVPLFQQGAAYTAHGWTNAFDPTEVTHAFESYGSAMNHALPLRNIAEVAVEDFFDFSSFRS